MANTRNQNIDILRTIGIILVVLGHAGPRPGFTILSSWFPIYGYHMALFVFISGYLYNPIELAQIGSFIKRKIVHWILPLLGWNFVYGILAYLLSKNNVTYYFTSSKDIFTLHNLIIEPFITGHQFYLNLATWFVASLFLTEIVYVTISYIRKWTSDWGIMFLLFSLGFIGTLLAKYEYKNFLLPLIRVLYFLPFFHLGYCYNHYIEEKEKQIKGYLFYPILLLIQIACVRLLGSVEYIVVFAKFHGHIVIPYIIGIIGILFWSRIARELSTVIKENKLCTLLATNTWSIMVHHLAIMFFINWAVIKIGIAPIDIELFKTQFYSRQPIIDYWFMCAIMLIVPPLLQQFRQNIVKSACKLTKLNTRFYDSNRIQ